MEIVNVVVKVDPVVNGVNLVRLFQDAKEGRVGLPLERVAYDPERFTGLILQMRLGDQRPSVLVFSTGSLVIMGLRDPEEAKSVVEAVLPTLKAYERG